MLGRHGLAAVLDVVGEVAEEIYAGALFQLVDADDVAVESLVAPVFVLVHGPEGEGSLLPVFLHDEGREEVFGDDEFVFDILQDAVFLFSVELHVADGAALAYPHGVGSS